MTKRNEFLPSPFPDSESMRRWEQSDRQEQFWLLQDRMVDVGRRIHTVQETLQDIKDTPDDQFILPSSKPQEISLRTTELYLLALEQEAIARQLVGFFRGTSALPPGEAR